MVHNLQTGLGKLSYTANFTTIRFIPMPDYNYVRPFGIITRSCGLERSALMSKQIEDKIICLYEDKDCYFLITFCARTGKFIVKHKVDQEILSRKA